MVDYLAGYSEELRDKALRLRREGVLEARLMERYRTGHAITTNAALYEFAQELKREHLRSSPPLLSPVIWTTVAPSAVVSPSR